MDMSLHLILKNHKSMCGVSSVVCGRCRLPMHFSRLYANVVILRRCIKAVRYVVERGSHTVVDYSTGFKNAADRGLSLTAAARMGFH